MKKAIIYVRGNKEEMQEIICRLYASDKNYKVLYITNNIDDVNLCDTMIISNPSRISRNQLEYYEVINNFKKKNITVEIATQHEKYNDFFHTAITLLN